VLLLLFFAGSGTIRKGYLIEVSTLKITPACHRCRSGIAGRRQKTPLGIVSSG